MRNLLLEEGDIIDIESVTLPVATFSKFQPLSSDFLDITNPKAVLENSLRNFACLSKNDIIAIQYNGHVYELCVLETKPHDAVNIIECDMNARIFGYSAVVHLVCVLVNWVFLICRWNLLPLRITKIRRKSTKTKKRWSIYRS